MSSWRRQAMSALAMGTLGACGVASPLGTPATTASSSGSSMTVEARGIVTATSGGFVATLTSGVTSIQFGVELHNQSLQLSALGIEVDATFSDDHGNATRPTVGALTGIPARGTFAFAGIASTFDSAPGASLNWVPQHMRVQVRTGRTSPAPLVLPAVSGLDLAQPQGMIGTVTNPYPGSAGAQWAGDRGTLYVTYQDGGGHFVGEDVVGLAALDLNGGAGVQPGAMASFMFATPIPSRATSALASIDPCIGSDSCVALQP